MTSLTSSLEIDQTYSFILSTMMTNRPSITPLHLAASARCGLRKCPGQGHIWQKGGPVQRCIWWATWVIFRLQKKTILHPSHLLQHRSMFGQAWKITKRTRFTDFWTSQKLGTLSWQKPIQSKKTHRTIQVVQVGTRHFHDFPVENCQDPPGWIPLDLQAFLHHRPHEIQPLVFFEKSGFFGWNQGIQAVLFRP